LAERECYANPEILKNCLRLITNKTVIFEEKQKSTVPSTPIQKITDDDNVTGGSRQDISEITTSSEPPSNWEDVSDQWDNNALGISLSYNKLTKYRETEETRQRNCTNVQI
jgi:hypothetical protein